MTAITLCHIYAVLKWQVHQKKLIGQSAIPVSTTTSYPHGGQKFHVVKDEIETQYPRPRSKLPDSKCADDPVHPSVMMQAASFLTIQFISGP